MSNAIKGFIAFGVNILLLVINIAVRDEATSTLLLLGQLLAFGVQMYYMGKMLREIN